MQVFEDGWAQCYAGCGRFHVSHYIDDLKDPNWKPDNQPKTTVMSKPIAPVAHEEKKPTYTEFDLFSAHASMEPIPRTHTFKSIPLDVLDSLGWRWTDGIENMGPGYFIPYYNHARTEVPFAQVRHLTGERRFTMLPGAEMTVYGKWNLNDGEKLFVVEGCSDAAVLEYACIPWVAIPSAAGGVMLANMARYCLAHGINLIYAGDNDEAGDKLKEALDAVMPYRVCQPPKQYKDWGEFLEGEGVEAIVRRCWEELNEPEVSPMEALASDVFGNQPETKKMF